MSYTYVFIKESDMEQVFSSEEKDKYARLFSFLINKLDFRFLYEFSYDDDTEIIFFGKKEQSEEEIKQFGYIVYGHLSVGNIFKHSCLMILQNEAKLF